jgi:FtsZ-binding cell division protein ZapB
MASKGAISKHTRTASRSIIPEWDFLEETDQPEDKCQAASETIAALYETVEKMEKKNRQVHQYLKTLKNFVEMTRSHTAKILEQTEGDTETLKKIAKLLGKLVEQQSDFNRNHSPENPAGQGSEWP